MFPNDCKFYAHGPRSSYNKGFQRKLFGFYEKGIYGQYVRAVRNPAPQHGTIDIVGTSLKKTPK